MKADPSTSALAVPAIVAAVFLMSAQDALVKFFSADFTLWQLHGLRSVIVLVLLFTFYGAARLRGPLQTRSFFWPSLRSLLLVIMYVLFLGALPFVDLSAAAACYYSGPLMITVLSSIVAKEAVSRADALCISTGFAGVLLVIQPWGAEVSLLLLMPLGAAACYATAAVVMRRRCASENLFAMSINLHGWMAATGFMGALLLAVTPLPEAWRAAAPFLLAGWPSLSLHALGMIGLLAVLSIGIHIGLVYAYGRGRPVEIAAFDYSYLVFAIAWGLLLFDEQLGPLKVLGVALIAGSGLTLLGLRQRSLAQP